MQYTALEQELIDRATKWRESPDFRQSIEWDNTPFFVNNDGIQMRATLRNGKWKFKVIVRTGYSGDEFNTLDESMSHAIAEAKAHRAKIDAQVEAYRQSGQ